ncbi:MAG: GNAT family protein [Alphaproteobacteria bacterium]|nr:GNAT family protein [Alphaproteobacteria bacterium]
MLELFKPAHRMPAEERIDGENVFIRPPQDTDWASWAELRNLSRDFLIPWEPTWPADGLTRSAYRRRVRHYADEWQSGIGYAFFVFSRAEGALRGGITLSNVRRGVSQSGTLGYWIGAPFAGQGIMTEALGRVMDYAFGQLQLHRLEAACLPRNEASKKVLQKNGFREEGFAPKYLKIDGNWEDHLLFAVLADEISSTKYEGRTAQELR